MRMAIIIASFSIAILVATAAASGELGKITLEDIRVSPAGKILCRSPGTEANSHSANGLFWCDYTVGGVTDEVRELRNFRLFERDQLLYSMDLAPGSDLYISNSGITAFMEMKRHYRGELTINFYSKQGKYLFSETFKGASLFGFSAAGNKFGVGTATCLYIISIPDHTIERYPACYQFDISEDENTVVIALPGKAQVYAKGKLVREVEPGFAYTRKIRVSTRHNILALIDKRHLRVYSLTDGALSFADNLRGQASYRDIVIVNGKVIAGINFRDEQVSKGYLKVYDQGGRTSFQREDSVEELKSYRESEPYPEYINYYDEVPWPFFPFDSMRTVWNYYEQHMGGWGPDWSYLHPGLDLIVPIGEPTYAVAGGIVKCVLTTGGERYWRIAISPEQSPGYSDGWLYAHLVESTIPFDVGDTVQIHDYLGDIVEWTEEWGHIHFVEIRDSGLVWQYDDNEWGINYNPLLSLRPHTDTIAPRIDGVFENSKLGFCRNETSIYLEPDSLYGDIDIIVKVTDYVGDSDWQQPAFETYYWVKKLPEGDIVFPRTLGQILNHSYDFYRSYHYEPYATLLYKRDEFLHPLSWMERQRNCHHILTNNNGDSVAALSEKELAFSTTDYPDGDYRIFVEALDEYGNSTVDSVEVRFRNATGVISQVSDNSPFLFEIAQNYPNPFNATTRIDYRLPLNALVKLEVYNLFGQQVASLVDERQDAGYNSVIWDASALSSGLYLYRLTAGDLTAVRRLTLVK